MILKNTELLSLMTKYINDHFLMELFWSKGYCSSTLGILNHCHLWLQVSTHTDITQQWMKNTLSPQYFSFPSLSSMAKTTAPKYIRQFGALLCFPCYLPWAAKQG